MMKLCDRCHKPAKLTTVFRTERFEKGKDDVMKVCPHCKEILVYFCKWTVKNPIKPNKSNKKSKV